MRSAQMIRSIIISGLLCIFYVKSETNTPQQQHTLSPQEEAQIAEIMMFAENVIIEAFNTLQRIENNLTEVTLLTIRGLLKKETDICKTIRVSTENRMTINALLQSQRTIIALKDPIKYLKIAFIISEFCNAFITYLDKQVAHKLKDTKPFNFTKFIKKMHTKNNLDDLEPMSLKKSLGITKAKLKAFDTTLKNIRLTWYNKIFRILDEWIVSPANKYLLPINNITSNSNLFWNFLRGNGYYNPFKPALIAVEPNVSFKDMIGLDQVKEEFGQIIQYIDNSAQLRLIRALAPHFWLLTGPARTGKSFSVECLCGEIKQTLIKRGLPQNMKYFNIPVHLINKDNIKTILETIVANIPAVVFIDNIDFVSHINSQRLNDFLQAIESHMNADPSKVVIVLAAANQPENINPPLHQNAHFLKKIRFEFPSKKDRIELIIHELSNMNIDLKEFDIETLANQTNGTIFEDLKRVIRYATIHAQLHGISLTQKLLEESINTNLPCYILDLMRN